MTDNSKLKSTTELNSLEFDLTTAKQNTAKAYNAGCMVTKHAESVFYLIPNLPSPPSWYESIQNHIDDCRSTSRKWIDIICPNAQQVQFNIIKSYSKDITEKGSEILNILTQIEMQPDQLPTSGQKEDVLDDYSYLLSVIDSELNSADGVQSELGEYHTTLAAEHSILSDDLVTIREHFYSASDWIDKINGYLSSDYLESQMVGVCSATVNIKSSVSAEINGTGANLETISAVYGYTFVESLSNNIAASQNALQALQNFWGTNRAKIESVKNDLEKSEGRKFTDILKSIDLEIAMTQWKQLAQFVEELTQQPVTGF
ncbi:hypothetical protein [Maridesulfovibrio bastinii]|uniref:hypothetical protein n=1 Tax=Maridesulfovibrio bastinii TaxID=47157 RepID=UPI00041D35DC|nr:hypothetical protein [Maridesulfovibrio bastinii]